MVAEYNRKFLLGIWAYVLCLFFSLGFTQNASAKGSLASLGNANCVVADLTCVQVSATGVISLSWVNNSGGANATVLNTYIYQAASYKGPYVLMDSVSGNSTTTYTDKVNNANNGIYYYFLKSACVAGGPSGNPSDTLNTLLLNVSNTGNGTAQLSWNSLTHSKSAGNEYKIYREYPVGTWTFLDSTLGLTYVDTITICSAHLNYQVQVQNPSGCLSVSSIGGGHFQNLIVPAVPFLDSVSVTANGQVQVGWEPSKSKDTKGYVVYKFINGVWQSIDTTWGINSTFFQYTLSNANKGVENYRIAAFDSCHNISPLGTTHNTLFITPHPNPCDRKILLTWNAYQNMGSGIKNYEVYCSVNGGAYALLQTNPVDSLSVLQTNLVQGANYCYKIIAYDNSGKRSSTSAILCYLAKQPPEPLFSYLAAVSVVSNSVVRISNWVDNAAEIKYYRVLRSPNVSGPFDSIGAIAVTHLPMVYFNDSTATTTSTVYYYKTIAVDTCYNDTTQTQISHTMLLNALATSNGVNQLSWNDYQLWSGGVSKYLIYRAVDSVWSATPIATINFTGLGTNTYLDNVSGFSNQKGVFSYKILALEGGGDIYGLTDSSWSNMANAYQGDIFYIPSAFVPNGVNKVFLPINNYIDTQEYDFRIFDRWGSQLFYTTDVLQGWYGKFHGTPCEQGVYVYLIRYKAANGQYLERKGSVALIK